MSADNWAICPGCVKKLERERTALAEKIQRSYGVITKEEYIDLFLEQTKLQEKTLARTLREDWKIGFWEGAFEVSYTAHCKICGFKHRFTHKEAITL